MRERSWLLLFGIGVAAIACGGPSRFALRAPVLVDDDARPFAPAPGVDAEQNVANALDVTLLGPAARAFLFETGGAAHNVNSLDEVPDSTWFVNRDLGPEEVRRGPCPEVGPTAPFVIDRVKSTGTTPGFEVVDANGRHYVLKLDSLPQTQPEISTAADAIVSRLYHAIGFNAPCNDVIYVRPGDLVVNERSTRPLPFGSRGPLSRAWVDRALAHGTQRADDRRIRMGASLFIEGEPIGTWRGEGTRGDDPNDAIPHEDRRELRGERMLAAWVAHWDSRAPNTFDAYVSAANGRGYVRHSFLDFSDSLGGVRTSTPFAEPRMGHVSVVDGSTILVDALGMGLVRRPWDEVRADPRYPNLGFLDVEHFVPLDFSPQTPLVRWSHAETADLAWAARRIARLGPAHVAAAVQAGRLSDPGEEAQLVEILLGRRERILRWAFEHASPLADLAVVDGTRFCAADLGLTTGVSAPHDVTYRVRARSGADLERAPTRGIERRAGGRLCVRLPRPFAPSVLVDDAPGRYAILEIARTERGRRTDLRAHLYDLGLERGYVLVGVERP